MAIGIQKQDLLASELVCGYAYYLGEDILAQKLQVSKDAIGQIQQQKQQILVMQHKDGDISQLPEVKIAYAKRLDELKVERQCYEETTTRDLKFAIKIHQKEVARFVIWLTLAILFSAIVVAFLLPTTRGIARNIWLEITSAVCSLLNVNDGFGTPLWLQNGIVVFASILALFSIVMTVIRHPKSDRSAVAKNAKRRLKPQNFQNMCDQKFRLTYEQFVAQVKANPNHYLHRQISLPQVEAKVRELNAQINLLQNYQQLLASQTKKLKAVGRDLEEDLLLLPNFCMQKSVMVQMLFLFISKRATTVESLLNFDRTNLMESSDSMMRNINAHLKRFTDMMDKNFRDVGIAYQLIDANIIKNAEQWPLEQSKLDKIADKQLVTFMKVCEHYYQILNIIGESEVDKAVANMQPQKVTDANQPPQLIYTHLNANGKFTSANLSNLLDDARRIVSQLTSNGNEANNLRKIKY